MKPIYDLFTSLTPTGRLTLAAIIVAALVTLALTGADLSSILSILSSPSETPQ